MVPAGCSSEKVRVFTKETPCSCSDNRMIVCDSEAEEQVPLCSVEHEITHKHTHTDTQSSMSGGVCVFEVVE